MIDPEPIADPIAYLEREGLSLVVIRSGEAIYTSHRPGIRPILELARWFATGLDECIIVDRVVGGCAARILAALRPRQVFGLTGSLAAETILHEHGVAFEFGHLVPEILNPAGTGLCPLETLNRQHADTRELVAALGRLVAD